MENIVNVEGTELDVREYNGQMVVTFDDIDLVHKRPSGTARKAFNRNKKRFINGVDYIVLEKENSNVHRVDIRNIDIPNRGKGSIVTLKHNFYLHIRFFILNLARI